jgi:hypothetical protein
MAEVKRGIVEIDFDRCFFEVATLGLFSASTCGAARKDAATQKRPLERVVTVIPAATKASGFSSGIKARNGCTRRVNHLTVEVGFQAT